MTQSLQTDNDHLKGKFSTLKKDTTNLMNKTQSMTKGTETLLREFMLPNVFIGIC